MSRAAFLLLAVVALLVVSPSPTLAAGAEQTGWWSNVPAGGAPDAPADGLVLQGGSDLQHPVAFGAVSFSLAAGEAPNRLQLAVAPNSATTPNASITICPLTKSFTPAQGGAMGSAPTFDCSMKVSAAVSSDGKSYSIDVGSLVRNGALSVALLPTTVTDRVVLSKPATTSLQGGTKAALSPASLAPSGSASSAAAAHAGTRPSVGGTVGVPSPAAAAPSSPQSAPAAPAARTANAQPAAERATAAGRSPYPTLAFVGLIALAAALWLSAGARSDTRPALLAAGGTPTPEGEPA